MATTKTLLSQWSRDDRDLLVELRTEVRAISQSLKEIKDETTARVAVIENGKVDKTDLITIKNASDVIHVDHEKRLRSVERSIWIYIGAAAILTWTGNLIVEHALTKLFGA